MPRFQAFLKQHLLWVGFLAVMIPLLVLLLLQYRSLTALQAALPARRKEELKVFLRAVINEVDDYYRFEADRALALPASTLGNLVSGMVELTGKPSEETVMPPIAATVEHFRAQKFAGAKDYFFAIILRSEGR